jgi:hypothetical protein
MHTRGKVYARYDKNGECFYLHRIIMGSPVGLEVDHVNGNTFNCTRKNLRKATHSENLMNRHTRVGRSGFRGVWPAHNGPGFCAVVKHKGVRICLGTFPTAEAAHLAYKQKAEQLFGAFVVWNRPTI